MTPEEKQQFEDMRRQLEEVKKMLESVLNVHNDDFIEKVVDSRVKRFADVTDSDVTIVAVDSNGDSVSVYDFPDKWKVFEYKGALYRIPVYLESRF
jgi:hypothetical protein